MLASQRKNNEYYVLIFLHSCYRIVGIHSIHELSVGGNIMKKSSVALRAVMMGVLLAVAVTSVFAQSKKKKSKETNVEEEFYGDGDPMVIYSLALSPELENKEMALKALDKAAEGGTDDPQIIDALDQLAGEGIKSIAKQKGRVVNNFPQVRRQACTILAKVGGEHSKNTLKEIALADNEPTVQAAAIKALGDIGLNKGDEVVNAIAFANHRNRVLNPTSSMAAEVLEAFEKLQGNTENKATMIEETVLIASNSYYNKAVRNRAKELLRTMKAGSNDNSDSENEETQESAE